MVLIFYFNFQAKNLADSALSSIQNDLEKVLHAKYNKGEHFDLI